MASPNSFSIVDHQAWEAQMDRASQSLQLNPTRTQQSQIIVPSFPPRCAYSSSRPPSMTSEEAPSSSQCISVHTPGQPGFADPQPTIDDRARDDVLYSGDSPSGRLYDLQGTSPSCYKNSKLPMEGEAMPLDLNESDLRSYHQAASLHNMQSQTQENEEPWSSLNTRVGKSSSELHQLLFWKNDSAREPMHAIDARHDGGHLVTHLSGYNGYPLRDFPPSSSATSVASIFPYGTGLSDQQHDLVDGRLSERDLDPHSRMPHTQDDQFDGASTATYRPDISLEHIQDLDRSVSRIDRRSGMESNFEPDTSQDNLLPRSNQMIVIRGQVPTNYDSRIPVVYGYQADPNLSYRQYLDNYRRYLPYYQRRGTNFRAHQDSNTMTSLSQPPGTPLGQSSLGDSTEHALSGAGARGSTVGPVRTIARAKGVRKGPLEENARAHARDTRGEGSCWPCKIQRYKCDADCGSEKCSRCKKMRGPPWPWGCIRNTLPSYANDLLAASLLDQHHPQELTRIFRDHIHEWSSSSIDIHVKWAHGPPIQVMVHEFRPNGTHLLFQDQYILSQRGYERVEVRSLPVGMTEDLLKDWRPTMHNYLDRIVDEPDFAKFPENCFRGDQNKAQRLLIHAVRRYSDSASNDRKRILRNSLKLLVCMKLASYSLILDEKNKSIVLERMRNPSVASAYGRFTASRFLNREIKYVVADIHRTLLDTELKNLQEALQASDTRRLSWGPAFVSVLILGIVTEIMQHLVRCKASSDTASLDPNDPSSMGRTRAIETRATDEINTMEGVVEFTRALFNRKYLSQDVEKGKGFKPIFKSGDRDMLDENSKRLALDVHTIICGYSEFLGERQLLGPSDRSGDPCVSRLVAKFMLSCKPN